MALLAWEPWQELQSIQEQMTRLLESSRARIQGLEGGGGSWQPAADILETPTALVIKVELPEVAHEDIAVRLENHYLVVEGQRQPQPCSQESLYHRLERPYGPFYRSFVLNAPVDEAHIEARSSQGVLEIVLPKKNQGQTQHIKIQTD